MAYIVKKKTKSGTYLYQVEAIWNKDKQQPRQKATYLGKEQPDGSAAPVRPKTVLASPTSEPPRRVLDFGSLTACRHLARTHGITAALEESFEPDTAETIFLLAVFLICEELPLFQFETWAAGVPHRFTGKPSAWTSTALSGLLHDLGRHAGARQTYQQAIVARHCQPDSRLLIDGTSVSTYGGLDEWAAYGHNRDGEHLPQFNIQFAVIEPGCIPVSLRMVEGSVPDVSTLLNTLEEMKAFGIASARTTLDRGYFSEANLNLLGYMLVLTDEEQRDPRDVLDDYRTRDAVEKLIDNFKNALNDDRIRVHSSEAAEGKLFLLLVALHLHAIIQRKLAPSRLQQGRRITPREAMLELRRIKSVTYATGAVLISEVAKRQRATLKLLGVPEALFASPQP